ncbi:ATP-binding protein [bacterium]|nr:ATP-binding protein [bacterium]
MNFYPRILENTILDSLQPGKVVLLVGARRVGKTVLINRIAKKYSSDALFLNGEDFDTQAVLEKRSAAHYKSFIGKHSLFIIDEAQKIPHIGQICKLMVDSIAGLRILLTGSSAFDLQNRFGEPLTGRKTTFQLYPLAQEEFSFFENSVETSGRLDEKLVFGNYPEIWQTDDNNKRVAYLKELAEDYLLKDILIYDGIRNAHKLRNLLRLIAFQIGKDVSYQELGRQLGISKNTVEKYLDLLTKVFVLYKVEGLSRNLRKEISKSSRWYFADTGIRNVFTANFTLPSLRQDMGQLWENYIISERLKVIGNNQMHCNTYFWRTYDQQEIDWVEERDGRLHGFEMKWGDSRVRPPVAWRRNYPDATFQVIHPRNYLEWLRSEAKP